MLEGAGLDIVVGDEPASCTDVGVVSCAAESPAKDKPVALDVEEGETSWVFELSTTLHLPSEQVVFRLALSGWSSICLDSEGFSTGIPFGGKSVSGKAVVSGLDL